jgi:hypothetical protein
MGIVNDNSFTANTFDSHIESMSKSSSYVASWKLCVLVCLAMVLLSLIPQIHLWIGRGRDWNGAYVSLQGDEPLYSAYINALIDGRARKNDPFGAKDDNPASPLAESTFSIQFVPAYVISFLARMSGASASTAMIALLGVVGLLASLSVFWLLNSVGVDYRLAAAGTLFVLCLGGLAGGHGLLGLLLKTGDLSMPSLPFLRRYQPATAFPLFFVFNLLVWRALISESKRVARVSAILAGLTLAVLVFSYLYLWTAAAAWLACIGLLWLSFRPADRRRALAVLATIAAIAAIALAPYAYLVSHRAATLDEQQTLSATRQLDLFRIPEILGALILLALIMAVRRKKIARSEPRVLFAASLALLSLVVFNQQVLTGRMMQPYHYAAFVVNYAVLVGAVVTAALFWKPMPARALVWIAALSFSWGFIEVGLPSRLNTVPAAVVNDQIIPVLRRLKELSRQDGTLADLRAKGNASTMVFSPQLVLTVLQPTWTSQGTLLDLGGLDFSSVSREERKKFFYMHLYYSQADIEALRQALNGTPNDEAMNYYARAVIFGHERIVPALSAQFQPIRPEEIEQETRAYRAYVDSFSREQVLKRPITYAVIFTDSKFDLSNIDRWYERDAGERVGAYTLYRLKVRE